MRNLTLRSIASISVAAALLCVLAVFATGEDRDDVKTEVPLSSD
jgi:hypothetical protein